MNTCFKCSVFTLLLDDCINFLTASFMRLASFHKMLAQPSGEMTENTAFSSIYSLLATDKPKAPPLPPSPMTILRKTPMLRPILMILPRKYNVCTLRRSMFSIPEHARIVVDRLEYCGYEAYVVGGCVRDSLLGRTPKDWDVCTNALPDEVLRVFRRFHVIKTGLKHGTVTVICDGESVEVTTFRSDGEYKDSRHPEKVTFTGNIAHDLSRRDFTVNAIAYNPREGLVDLFCGEDDIRKRLIRCVGDPEKRFEEDALRILRAFRFMSKLDFEIDGETYYAQIRNGVAVLDDSDTLAIKPDGKIDLTRKELLPDAKK